MRDSKDRRAGIGTGEEQDDVPSGCATPDAMDTWGRVQWVPPWPLGAQTWEALPTGGGREIGFETSGPRE